MARLTCWLWTGAVSSEGYGRWGRHYVHRWVYENFVGPIPEGHQVDHLCRNRLCYRPEHLEAVTQRENILRGRGATARHAKKDRCIRGHKFDGVRKTPSGTGRTCSTCQRKARRRSRARQAVS